MNSQWLEVMPLEYHAMNTPVITVNQQLREVLRVGQLPYFDADLLLRTNSNCGTVSYDGMKVLSFTNHHVAHLRVTYSFLDL